MGHTFDLMGLCVMCGCNKAYAQLYPAAVCAPMVAPPPPPVAAGGPIPQWAATATHANADPAKVRVYSDKHTWFFGPLVDMNARANAPAICLDCRKWSLDMSGRRDTCPGPAPTPPQGMFTGGIVAGNTVAPPPLTGPQIALLYGPPAQTYGGITSMDPGVWSTPPPPAAKSGKAKCPDCVRELSSTLDAYFGRDDFLRKRCVDCRTKVEKRDTILDRLYKTGVIQ